MLGQVNSFRCRPLLTRLLMAGLLAIVELASFGFAGESRPLGSDNSSFIRGSPHSHGKKGAQKASRHRTTQALTDAADSSSADPAKTSVRAKTQALNASLLEEQVPEFASLQARIQEHPASAVAHFELAACYHRYRVLDKAHEEFQKAIQLDPNNVKYLEASAKLSKDWGDVRSATLDLQKVVQLKPDSVSAWNSLGAYFDDLGDLDQALNCYRKALTLARDLDYLHSNLCFAYLRKEEYQDAILHGEEAIRLNPENKVAHNNLGLAYGLTGSLDRAFEEFRFGGDEASAHNNLGLVLLKLGRPDEAMEQFKKAIRLRPFYKLAVQNYIQAKALKVSQEKEKVSKGESKRG